MSAATRLAPPKPTFFELFTPKLVTVFREGYTAQKFRSDVLAGLTVAIVALPLSMAIAIASGATPDRGLYTAIVAGFVISALGGSRFQIGGPAGAFIVLVAATLERHGYDGFVLATIIAGFLLMALGFLRLGTYIKYIPHSVIVGFTSGIAVIILASQLRDLGGLTLHGKEPAAFLPKLEALWEAVGTVNPTAVAIAAASIAMILLLKRYRPTWPGLLIAVTLTARPPRCSAYRWRRSARASVVSRARCQPPTSPRSAWRRCCSSFRTRLPSRCWAGSSPFSPRSWPMA